MQRISLTIDFLNNNKGDLINISLDMPEHTISMQETEINFNTYDISNLVNFIGSQINEYMLSLKNEKK